MFIEALKFIPKLAGSTNFSIFAVDPFKAKLELKKAFKTDVIFLEPDEKSGKISVENVRDFTALTGNKDTKDRFFAVLNAETMNEAAENAFLKNLEEPAPNHHFILLTKTPSVLLPTVLSRAQIFYLKETDPLTKPVEVDEKVKALAKQLITTDTKNLISLANDLSKKKDNSRAYAQQVVGVAIEILYKSYFATGQEKFLKKLPKLLKLYDSLQKNGHVKLHIVADMI